MILTHHSGACIRASAGDTTLVFGPVSKQSKNFKPTNFGADVAFIPINHNDMNGAGEAGRGDKQPFVVFGPGEYEIKEITASGFPTSKTTAGDLINTVYSVKFDGLNVLYLGALLDVGVVLATLVTQNMDHKPVDRQDDLIIGLGFGHAPDRLHQVRRIRHVLNLLHCFEIFDFILACPGHDVA